MFFECLAILFLVSLASLPVLPSAVIYITAIFCGTDTPKLSKTTKSDP